MEEYENSVAAVLKQYNELKSKLQDKEKMLESKIEEYDEQDLSIDVVKDDLTFAEKNLNEKRFEMYDAKSEYISNREFKHNLKCFLLGCAISLLISLFPQTSVLFASKIATLLLIFSGGFVLELCDSILFHKKNIIRYNKDFSNSDKFKKITSEYEILAKEFKEKLNKFNNAVMKYQQCESDIDILKKEIRDIEYSLSKLYADTFMKIYGDYLDEKCEDKPLELKRK